jgi:hypothetical protein
MECIKNTATGGIRALFGCFPFSGSRPSEGGKLANYLGFIYENITTHNLAMCSYTAPDCQGGNECERCPFGRSVGTPVHLPRVALVCLTLLLMESLLELAKFVLRDLFFFIQNLSPPPKSSGRKRNVTARAPAPSL